MKKRELMQWCVSEIERLRRLNEIQAAKLEGVEMMAMAVASERHHGPGIPMQEDLLYRIKNILKAEEPFSDELTGASEKMTD